MNRATIAAASALVASLALPAQADPPPPRHVVVDYVAPTSVRGVAYQDAEIQFRNYGSATTRTLKTDRFVTVTVRDSTGLPVPYSVTEDVNGSGQGNVDLGEFCGGGTNKLRIQPGLNIIVYLEVGLCGTAPAAATTGTVDFALSRR
jgi:hypothetical protein